MNYTQNELQDIYKKDALEIYKRHKEDLQGVDLKNSKGLYLLIPILWGHCFWFAKFDVINKKLLSIGNNYWQDRITYKKRFLRKPKKIVESYITEISYEVSKLEWILKNECYEKQ